MLRVIAGGVRKAKLPLSSVTSDFSSGTRPLMRDFAPEPDEVKASNPATSLTLLSQLVIVENKQ